MLQYIERKIMETFFATLVPMLTLFLCITIGFALAKAKILHASASETMAKMEMWIFCPALSFMTMVRNCTVGSLSTHATNLILGAIVVGLSVALSLVLSPLFVKEKGIERGIYAYALAIANLGYIGDPVVLALFGDEILAYYKLFTLPFSILIYTWGVSVMMPKGQKKESFFKRVLNPPTVALIVGIVVGLTGLGDHLPAFVTSSLDSLKACMGPIAMILAGVTIARYDLLEMIKNKKVYIATGLRLFILPAVLIAALLGIKELANALFSLSIGNDVLFLCLFATAGPLGLNTVVFPEAYGGNPKTGASMALVSHTLCAVSIPLMYALMVAIFGTPFNVL